MSAQFVLGTVQLGLAYGRANVTGKPSQEAALALIRQAWDNGVTAFDTARAYGDSEERLGEALMGRSAHIVTKLSPLADLGADVPLPDVRDAVDRSLERSLAALRRDRIEVCLLHEFGHFDAFGGAIWTQLLEHQAQGRICTLGASVGSPHELRRALAEPAVRHIQLAANLLDWRWCESGLLDALHNVTVHVRSTLLQGILAADVSVWPRIEGVDPVALSAWLADSARALGRDGIVDLALAYIRAQDWVDGAVLGLETQSQLQANLALFARPPLTADECAFIDKTRPRVPASFLDPPQWPKT